jgi:hypothetical protein
MYSLKIIYPGIGIQVSIDSLPAGGTLYFELGEYTIDKTIEINKSFNLEGRQSSGNLSNIESKDVSTALNIDMNYPDPVTVTSLCFKGNNKNTAVNIDIKNWGVIDN